MICIQECSLNVTSNRQHFKVYSKLLLAIYTYNILNVNYGTFCWLIDMINIRLHILNNEHYCPTNLWHYFYYFRFPFFSILQGNRGNKLFCKRDIGKEQMAYKIYAFLYEEKRTERLTIISSCEWLETDDFMFQIKPLSEQLIKNVQIFSLVHAIVFMYSLNSDRNGNHEYI